MSWLPRLCILKGTPGSMVAPAVQPRLVLDLMRQQPETLDTATFVPLAPRGMGYTMGWVALSGICCEIGSRHAYE
jgi:hypothetical protein